MSHAAIVITSKDHFDQVVSEAGDQPVIIDFTAAWCPPCQMIKPIFEQLAEEFKGRAVLVKIDVDDRDDLAREFGI